MRYAASFAVIGLLLAVTATAGAVQFHKDDFETAWAGSHAPGWSPTPYEWGTTAPTTMTQVLDPAGGTNQVLELTVTGQGDPVSSTAWWGGVYFDDTTYRTSMRKEFSPYVSVRAYDTRNGSSETGDYLPSGCLVSIPVTQLHYDAYGDYVYDINVDWTDLQHGTRHGDASDGAKNYYHYGSAPDHGGAGWTATSILREVGWHEYRMELSPAGVLTYLVDGNVVGTSPRTDYLDLRAFNLYVWRSSGATGDDATVYFDDFEFGAVPEPVTMAGLMLGVGSLVGYVRRRRK